MVDIKLIEIENNFEKRNKRNKLSKRDKLNRRNKLSKRDKLNRRNKLSKRDKPSKRNKLKKKDKLNRRNKVSRRNKLNRRNKVSRRRTNYNKISKRQNKRKSKRKSKKKLNYEIKDYEIQKVGGGFDSIKRYISRNSKKVSVIGMLIGSLEMSLPLISGFFTAIVLLEVLMLIFGSIGVLLPTYIILGNFTESSLKESIEYIKTQLNNDVRIESDLFWDDISEKQDNSEIISIIKGLRNIFLGYYLIAKNFKMNISLNFGLSRTERVRRIIRRTTQKALPKVAERIKYVTKYTRRNKKITNLIERYNADSKKFYNFNFKNEKMKDLMDSTKKLSKSESGIYNILPFDFIKYGYSLIIKNDILDTSIKEYLTEYLSISENYNQNYLDDDIFDIIILALYCKQTDNNEINIEFFESLRTPRSGFVFNFNETELKALEAIDSFKGMIDILNNKEIPTEFKVEFKKNFLTYVKEIISENPDIDEQEKRTIENINISDEDKLITALDNLIRKKLIQLCEKEMEAEAEAAAAAAAAAAPPPVSPRPTAEAINAVRPPLQTEAARAPAVSLRPTAEAIKAVRPLQSQAPRALAAEEETLKKIDCKSESTDVLYFAFEGLHLFDFLRKKFIDYFDLIKDINHLQCSKGKINEVISLIKNITLEEDMQKIKTKTLDNIEGKKKEIFTERDKKKEELDRFLGDYPFPLQPFLKNKFFSYYFDNEVYVIAEFLENIENDEIIEFDIDEIIKFDIDEIINSEIIFTKNKKNMVFAIFLWYGGWKERNIKSILENLKLFFEEKKNLKKKKLENICVYEEWMDDPNCAKADLKTLEEVWEDECKNPEPPWYCKIIKGFRIEDFKRLLDHEDANIEQKINFIIRNINCSHDRARKIYEIIYYFHNINETLFKKVLGKYNLSKVNIHDHIIRINELKLEVFFHIYNNEDFNINKIKVIKTSQLKRYIQYKETFDVLDTQLTGLIDQDTSDNHIKIYEEIKDIVLTMIEYYNTETDSDPDPDEALQEFIYFLSNKEGEGEGEGDDKELKIVNIMDEMLKYHIVD